MDRSSRRTLKTLVVVAAAGVALWAAAPWWLGALGRALVRDDGPSKADIAVVLAGDYTGNRIRRAADLVRDGYVPAALVDGPDSFFGSHESEFAIAYMRRCGYPAAWFIELPMDARSTRAEAEVVIPELRRRGIRNWLLVTSDFHSARAARTFRSVARARRYGESFRVVTAPDIDFHAESWWKTRQGRKAAFFEWTKTIAEAAGL